MIHWHGLVTSSCNRGSTSGWIIFAWPTFFDSTCLDWPFYLKPIRRLFFQPITIFSKCIDIYLKSEIYTKQKLHFQPVQFFFAYSSNSGIVRIVKESAKAQGTLGLRVQSNKICKKENQFPYNDCLPDELTDLIPGYLRDVSIYNQLRAEISCVQYLTQSNTCVLILTQQDQYRLLEF